jgi:myo-inositol-1(or 4)-monophosphatase
VTTAAPEFLAAIERAVDEGAALLQEGRWHSGSVIAKGDRDYATEVDVRIEETVRAALQEAAPEIAFLGEEEGSRGPSGGEAMWVLDPIDGTVNFANGSPLCAISLALVERGEPTLGIVDLPLLGERYIARRGSGAFLNGRRTSVVEKAGLREAIVGFADFAVGPTAKEENPVHRELMSRLVERCLRVRVHGSESLDLAWLAAGHLDVSVMLSSRPWDVTAGVLIASEAGAEAFDQHGSPWSYRSPVTICSTPGLASELMPVVQEAVEAAEPFSAGSRRD